MKVINYIFIILFLGIYGLINFYIGLRAYKALSYLSISNGILYWGFFVILASSTFVVRIFDNKFGGKFFYIFELISDYWLAILVYSLIILLFYDIIGIVAKIFGLNEFWINPKFMILRLLVSTCVLILILIYGNMKAKDIVISEYEIRTDKKLPEEELKIVLASDFHLGNIINERRLKIFINKVNEIDPDIVLLAGDIIDENHEIFDRLEMDKLFKELKVKYGIFACLGNHEYFRENTDEIKKSLERGNIKVLRDEVADIGDFLTIIGREDVVFNRFGGKRKSIDELFKAVDKNRYIILLDHQPKEIDEAIHYGVDLQVSGHTHKGQFFPINLFTKRLFVNDYGHYAKGEYNLIVTSGFGTWGPPIRIGSRSEIVVIKVIQKQGI